MIETEPRDYISHNQYSIDSPVGRIRYTEVIPNLPKTEIPVVIAPGWGATPASYDLVQKVLAERECRSLVLDHPRRGGKVQRDFRNFSYPTAELRKAQAFMALIDRAAKDENNNPVCEKVDIIAHSEGAIYGLIAAMLQPDKIRNIILVAPAGLVGKDTFWDLAGRFSLEVIQDMQQVFGKENTAQEIIKTFIQYLKKESDENDKTRKIRETLASTKYVAGNPLRALDEAVASSGSDISGMLKDIHAKGIGIAVICHANDKAIPIDRVSKVIFDNQVDGELQVDGVLSVTGFHDDLYVHPDIYTRAAEEMLTALENKLQKRK